MHQLKTAYHKEVEKRYGIRRGGDKFPEKTESIAQKVAALGVSNETFISTALTIWEGMLKGDETKEYPYWNMVASNLTFQMIEDLIRMSGGLSEDPSYDYFMIELEYASGVLAYWKGDIDEMPMREVKVNGRIMVQVGEYLCSLHGVEYITSDYYFIAKQVRNGK